MTNFENACLISCQNMTESIKIEEVPNYSKKHKNRIDSLARGRHVGNVYISGNLLRVLIACILILALNIVAFAYLGTKSESKDLIFYESEPVTLGAFTTGTSINIRVDGASYKDHKPIKDLACGYIPDGYNEIPIHESEMFAWKNVDGNYIYYRRDFEKTDADGKIERIYISKVIESNGVNVLSSCIILDAESDTLNPKDSVDTGMGNVQIKSPSLDWVLNNLEDFTENGIHYYYLPDPYENANGGKIYWDFDGYIYEVHGSLPLEELKEISKTVK